jgi:hypothetical protein
MLSSAPLVEVSAVLEVLTPPEADSLYFWALQVEFEGAEGRQGPGADVARPLGGGHTGLQWHRAYPGSTAVNWGGYASAQRGGTVLLGSDSGLPGLAGEPNTRAYPWKVGRPYRLRVYRSPEGGGAWRAEVEDVIAGEATVIRDLFAGAAYLAAPVVWSEVFADCDAPSVSVRWSAMQARDSAGAVLLPEGVAVNYQSAADGGCANTTSVLDGHGVLQITNTPRTTPQGAWLKL